MSLQFYYHGKQPIQNCYLNKDILDPDNGCCLQALQAPKSHLTALSKCRLPFHWPRQDLDQLLCVRLLDVASCHWSGGFRIDKIDSFQINMRSETDAMSQIVIERRRYFRV
jgi:hypothetical protein